MSTDREPIGSRGLDSVLGYSLKLVLPSSTAYHRNLAGIAMRFWVFLIAAIALLTITAIWWFRRPSELQKLQREVQLLIHGKRFEEALPVAERAVEVAEQGFDDWTEHHGKDHSNLIVTGQIASALSMLGKVQVKLQNPVEAEGCFRRAITVLEGAVTEDLYRSEQYGSDPSPHFHLPDALQELAFFYADVERFDEAADTHRRALEAAEAILGGNDPALAGLVVNLGDAYNQLDQVEQAETAFLRAIALLEPISSEDKEAAIILVAALNNMGQMHNRQGRREEARAAVRRALEIAVCDLGEDHPLVEGIRGGLEEIEGE